MFRYLSRDLEFELPRFIRLDDHPRTDRFQDEPTVFFCRRSKSRVEADLSELRALRQIDAQASPTDIRFRSQGSTLSTDLMAINEVEL